MRRDGYREPPTLEAGMMILLQRSHARLALGRKLHPASVATFSSTEADGASLEVVDFKLIFMPQTEEPPKPERTMTVEACFHRRLASLVNKKTQGHIMEAFRAAMSESLEVKHEAR